MRIQHRFAMHEDDPLWPELRRSGAEIDSNNSYIWVCVLDDDSPIWKEFKTRLMAKPGLVSSRAIYSADEIQTAEFLEIVARGHHGFPQPETNLDFLDAVYGHDGHCAHCGIAHRQIAPFRLRKEFGAKHSQFLQLNLVFDEFFVRNAVAQAMSDAGITGVSWQAPVIHRTGEPSTEVVQMMVETVLEPALQADGHTTTTCAAHQGDSTSTTAGAKPDDTNGYCGQIKYRPGHSGPLRFKSDAFAKAPDIVKAAEWFGSEANAFRRVLVSQKLYRLISDAGWRGLEFEPVELF